MSATTADGRQALWHGPAETVVRVAAFSDHWWSPGLATVLIGSNATSEVDVLPQRIDAGLVYLRRRLLDHPTEAAAIDVIDGLAAGDPEPTA